MVGRSLGRQERVRTSHEYRRVDSEGLRYASERLFLLVRRNDLGLRRLGLVVGRRVGNSVRRNQVKRWIREAFRADKQRFPECSDLVVVARSNSEFAGFGDLRDELWGMTREGRIVARSAGRTRGRR